MGKNLYHIFQKKKIHKKAWGETHETKNEVSEEAQILVEKVIQTVNDTLQNN
jgi:hypothetical protein